MVILFTSLAYRYDGLRTTDTQSLLYAMASSFAREGGPSLQRPSGRRFQRWLEDACVGQEEKVLVPLQMAAQGDEWQRRALHATLRQHVAAQEHYLEAVVLPECLKYHESRLGATGAPPPRCQNQDCVAHSGRAAPS